MARTTPPFRKRAPHEDFETFFEELPCAVLVLGEGLRLVSFNRSAFDYMYDGTPEVLNLLVGDAIGCVHASEGPNGCGTTPACRDCALRKTAEDTLRTGKRGCVIAPMVVCQRDSMVEVSFLVATSTVQSDGDRLVLLTLQDLSDLRGVVERPAACCSSFET